MDGSCRRHAGQSGARPLALLTGCLLALLVAASGCGNPVELHPALVLQPEEIERATAAGKSLACAKASPYLAYTGLMKDVNTRVSADVIIRQAAACWPRSEIAFEIAKQGDTTDAGISRAVNEALRRVEQQLKFVVLVQLPTTRDPVSIEFEMRALGNRYPPVAVERPAFVREVSSALDPDMPPSALWSYDVWFPIKGSPGYPPIDVTVNSLALVVKDGEAGAEVWFSLPQKRTSAY